MTAKPTPTPRKRRPSYSLSPAAIARLAWLTQDTARHRGTKPNASGLLEELLLDEVRRRHGPEDGMGPGTAKGRVR